MTSHSRCAKDSAWCDTKILSSSRTSGVGVRVVEEFRSCCCFLGKLLKNFVADYQSLREACAILGFLSGGRL